MTAARVRLVVSALLVAGWFGYLGYLALAKEPAVVVPRPQLLVATHIVKAKVADLNGFAVESSQLLKGDGRGGQLQVERLDEARLPGNKPLPVSGEYLLLLEKMPGGRYRFAGDPKTPVAYPWTPDVERQVQTYLSR